MQIKIHIMDQQFTQKEKEAMFSVLCVLVKADYRSRTDELGQLSAYAKELGIDGSYQPIPKAQLEGLAYETLKRMSIEKKRVFSGMMTQIARSDGHFGPSERAFVIEILEMCEIPFVHRGI